MCYRPRSAVAGVALPSTIARHKQRCSLSAPAGRSVASAAAYVREELKSTTRGAGKEDDDVDPGPDRGNDGC
jgi:hypothetical protein